LAILAGKDEDWSPLFHITDYSSHASYSSTLKLKAAGFSETLVNIYQTIWHHIPEDSIVECRYICQWRMFRIL
jgi:hypothetical protein